MIAKERNLRWVQQEVYPKFQKQESVVYLGLDPIEPSSKYLCWPQCWWEAPRPWWRGSQWWTRRPARGSRRTWWTYWRPPASWWRAQSRCKPVLRKTRGNCQPCNPQKSQRFSRLFPQQGRAKHSLKSLLNVSKEWFIAYFLAKKIFLLPIIKGKEDKWETTEAVNICRKYIEINKFWNV